MLYSNGAAFAVKACVIIAVAFAAAFGPSDVLAQQSNSRIEVIVCPSPTESDLRIIAPSSDSII